MISNKISENVSILDKLLGVGVSYDVSHREFIIKDKKIQCYFVTGLCDATLSTELFKQLVKINDLEVDKKKLVETIENRLVHFQVEKVTDIQSFVEKIVSGLLGIIVDGYMYGFIIDVRSYPTRSPQEPDTEKVVRGSRDGFTENIIINTALVRRRAKDHNLRNELFAIGDKTKIDVCLSYVEGITPPELVEDVRKRITSIKIDELAMSDKALEELIVKQKFNPYPLVRYSERPDTIATHLYQGLVAIIVDTSPSVILGPITIFDHIHHAEEYRQTPLIGTFLRLIRFLGILIAMFVVPVWLLFVIQPELLPEALSFIGPEKNGNVPVVLQILIAELGIEFLRMAAIHTPTPLSTAMGLIAGVLVGQIAIDVGLFTPEVVLYVAVSAIGNYLTPSYELSLANKLCKMIIIVITYFFKLPGLLISSSIWFIFLASLKSFNKPYLYPLIPLNIPDLVKTLIRFPMKNKKGA
ncbi:spore germination protein [Mycoplasmatota bacterium]|nr:spore germination protein [Mycoplasmatota bacterium]